MVFGSTMLWTGLPVGWLWVASQFSDPGRPSLAPYAIVILGLVASVALDYKLLVRLNARHARLRDRLPDDTGERSSWLRSLRDDRSRDGRSSALESIMLATVAAALVCFVVWFLALAHPAGPG